MTTAQINAWTNAAYEATTTCEQLTIGYLGAVQAAQSSNGVLDPSYGASWAKNCPDTLLGPAPSNAPNPKDIQNTLHQWNTLMQEGKLFQTFYSTPLAGWDNITNQLLTLIKS